MFSIPHPLCVVVTALSLLFGGAAGAEAEAFRNDGAEGDPVFVSVVSLFQEFDQFYALRVDAAGDIDICRFNIGRLIERKKITQPSGRLSELLDKFVEGLEELALKPPQARSPEELERELDPEVMRDGAEGQMYCIFRQGDRYLIFDLDLGSDLANLLGLAIMEFEESAESLPSESGAILWVFPPWSRDFALPRSVTLGEDVPAQLLPRVGVFIPEDELGEFPSELNKKGDIGHLDLDPVDFTLWRLKSLPAN